MEFIGEGEPVIYGMSESFLSRTSEQSVRYGVNDWTPSSAFTEA